LRGFPKCVALATLVGFERSSNPTDRCRIFPALNIFKLNNSFNICQLDISLLQIAGDCYALKITIGVPYLNICAADIEIIIGKKY
jgi:hypothetical protein